MYLSQITMKNTTQEQKKTHINAAWFCESSSMKYVISCNILWLKLYKAHLICIHEDNINEDQSLTGHSCSEEENGYPNKAEYENKSQV